MKVLIAYATYSGSTLMVAQKVKEILENHHYLTDIKDVMELKPQDLAPYDVILLGSCTWKFETKDGQPHLGFIKFRENIQNTNLQDKYFAAFATGDENYLHFCSAADYLSECIRDLKGKELISPLRINQYYFHEEENNQIVKHWVDNVCGRLEGLQTN